MNIRIQIFKYTVKSYFIAINKQTIAIKKKPYFITPGEMLKIDVLSD